MGSLMPNLTGVPWVFTHKGETSVIVQHRAVSLTEKNDHALR